MSPKKRKIKAVLNKVKLFFALSGIVCSCFAAESSERKIVCFGDSLTSCGGNGGRYSDMLQKSLPSCKVINRGRSGDTIGGALERLERDVLSCKADILVIGIGANDYWQRKRPLCDLKRDFGTILERCHLAGMKIVIISCFGNEKISDKSVIIRDKAGIPLEHYAAGIAEFEREFAEKYRAEYVPDMQINIVPKGRRDLWSDSNHPNAEGNRIVADTILPALRKVMQ